MKKILLVLVAISSIWFQSAAFSIVVHTADGKASNYESDDIVKIQFGSAGNVTAYFSDDTNVSFTSSEFNFLSFNYDPNNQDEPDEPDTPDDPDTPDNPDDPDTPDNPDDPDTPDNPDDPDTPDNPDDPDTPDNPDDPDDPDTPDDPDDPAGITDAQNASLHLEGAVAYAPEGLSICVYDINGVKCLYSAESQLDLSTLAPGIYVISAGSQSLKVAIQ